MQPSFSDRDSTAGFKLPDRFFPVTIHAGLIHVRRIPFAGPWNYAQLEWRDEAEAECFVDDGGERQKVRTREELNAIVLLSQVAGTWEIWIHGRLVDEARRLWEDARRVARIRRRS
jgi:hypothetical protein